MRRSTLLVAAALALLLPATAAGAPPPKLWQSPEDGQTGSTAGRIDLGNFSGMGANPNTGSVYVTDRRNLRVSEFTAWGEFVRAWGWGVRNGDSELQTCGPAVEPPSGCQKGAEGSGPGQFGIPGNESLTINGGLAVDPDSGAVYVADMANHRVQKFDSEGNFLLMFGGEVNKTTKGDVCTAASDDVCGAGVAGEGNGEFANQEFGDYIDVGPGGSVFVGDKGGRIQEFNSAGEFQGSALLTGEPAGKILQSLEVDSVGNFFVTVQMGDPIVYKAGPAGEELEKRNVFPVRSLALDTDDNLYVVTGARRVVAFGPGGEALITADEKFAEAPADASLIGVAVNTVTADGQAAVYTVTGSTPEVGKSYLTAYSPPPDLWPPPLNPPQITAQYATSVGTDAAVLGAEINPRFWDDTNYRVEYGPGKCSEGSCETVLPSSPVKLGAGLLSVPVKTKGIVLSGLEPDTTYRYRFVSQSSGGGPVRGVGPGEAEGAFTTRKLDAPGNVSCPNQVFRTGAGARLPDCRAYEMVTPLDKNGTDIFSLIQIGELPAAHEQSAEAGGKLTYTTPQGFGDTQGVPYVSQYVASRTPDGWQNHGITPPQGHSAFEVATRIDVEFRAFTPDLCRSVLLHTTEEMLAPGAAPGFSNLYRRQNCGEEGYEALTPPPLMSAPADQLWRDVQGFTPDGRCTVFSAPAQLTSEADAGIKYQLYLSCDGVLRTVSMLPDGTPFPEDSRMGTGNGGVTTGVRTVSVKNALSADGSRVYWTASDGQGPLYLRERATQSQSAVNGSGKCTQPARACTYPVSKGLAFFWAAAKDGSKAIYTEHEDLFEFDATSKESTLIAGEAEGVAGASDDADRYYFVSREALASGAVAGEPNLYLREGSESVLVATLVEADMPIPGAARYLSLIQKLPFKRSSRVSPEGHLVFMSAASLTGYDNVDAVSGEPAFEVFVYDAGSRELSCASCNPTGARPVGQKVRFLRTGDPSLTHAAAYIPGFLSQLYGSRAIADDGSRAFFNSFESLVPGDTNGVMDVYQWEQPGSGDCTESSPAYSQPNGGCLALVSSGESATASEFIDASADGADVFFKTDLSLVAQDPGLIDIYDARVGGGYPPPPPQPASCEGEACQGPISAPNDPTPASSAFQGAGNVREAPTRCARPKVRRRGRCVRPRKSARAKGKQRRRGQGRLRSR